MMLHIHINHGNRVLAIAVLACFLAVLPHQRAMAAPASPGTPVAVPESPSLHLSLEANASSSASDEPEGGIESDVLIEAGGAVIRVWAAQAYEMAPVAGLAVSLPYLRFGSTRPAGLSAFVHTPASAETLLLGLSGAPLVLDDPADPACLGLSLGEDYGVFAEAPGGSGGLPDPGRAACGVWFSPRGGYLSALALVSDSPVEAGGAGWYDVPVPAAERVFAALSGRAAGTRWAMAVAAAGSAGFPGQDAAACRAEARVSAGGFRLDAEGSAASAAWAGPDGRSSPFLRLAADARYARFGYAAVLGFRYVQAYVPERGAGIDGADVTWSGALEAISWFGQARASASLQSDAVPAGAGAPETGAAAVVVVDTRWKPDFAPWLTLASSWRASNGESERFDLSVQALFGKTIRFSIGSGLRFVADGRLINGAFSGARTMGAALVGCSVRTSGWIEPGADWPDSLAYSIRVTAALE
jgi:hypothetical protein